MKKTDHPHMRAFLISVFTKHTPEVLAVYCVRRLSHLALSDYL